MSREGELRVHFISVLGLLIGALVPASVSADEVSRPTATVSVGGVLKLAPGTSEILRVNPGARTVIIGKPEIVDANILSENVIVLTAKGTGWTNMILLDAENAVVLRTDVQVADVQVGSRPTTVQVFHGDKVQSYSCTTNCIAAPTASVNNTELTAASGPFRNCDEARAAGATAIRRGEPGYAPHLDGDNDGVGCE
jgi:hypothetical protein